MKLSTLFFITAVLALFFGIGSLVVPSVLFGFYGFAFTPTGEAQARLFGAVQTSFGLLNWMVRNEGPSNARRAIVFANFVANGLSLIVALLAIGLGNALVWSAVVLYLLLTAGFAYFHFVMSEVTGS